MRLSANETTMPRLHLIGTLVLILVVTLAMTGFFSWQNEQEQGHAFKRVAQLLTQQQKERLTAEMRSALDYVDFVHQRTEDVLRSRVIEQVDVALDMAQAIHARESGRRPAAEVKQLIMEALRPVQFFDGRGYLFIDDMQGQFVLLPTAPQYEGRSGIDNQDDQGTYIMRGLIAAAHQPPGESFFRYRWYRPDNPLQMAEKLAYVRHFAPYDWLIGSGDYVYEWETRQKNEAMQRLRALRFGDSGTVGLIAPDGRSLLSPNDIAIEGLLPEKMPPLQRAALDKIRTTALAGGGFVEYEWPRVGHQDGQQDQLLGRKTALVSVYGPWNWVLVTAMFNDELQSTLRTETQAYSQGSTQRRLQLALLLCGALALGVIGSFGFSRWSRHLFMRYHRELAAANANLRVAAIAFESQEGMCVTDPQGVILRVNQSFTRITGYSAEEAVGQTPALLKSGRHDAPFYDCMHSVLASTGVWQGEIWNRRKDGSVFPEWLTITAVKTEVGVISHFVSTLIDITQRKEDEEKIRYLAYYDLLTLLPNRRLLMDRLQRALATSRRTQYLGALMFIDLDNFKLVNDSLGHDKGDLLLHEMAQRLSAAVREIDTVARLGGDEFVVVLENLNTQVRKAARQAEDIAEKIRSALAQPMLLAEQSIQSSCSIGVVLFTDAHASADDLMKHADLAMYQAKEAGRNTVRFFDPQMHAAVLHRVALEQDLRTALQDGHLVLFYQVQVDALGHCVGVEALVRWRHPQRGLVSPGEFIPLAEECGLILPLGQWVLHSACEQLARWAHEPAHTHLTVAVNVSGRQMIQSDFVAQVLQTLARTGAPAQRLKLELTESLLLDNPQDAITKMSELKANGVGFSLDDFGTGYSSLAYLRQLPLDQIKIDQSFVHNLVSDPRAMAIVRTIVTLADNLDLSVIAEGVETEAQRQSLATHGCHAYQGYLFGRPVPIEELIL
ncbi:bifunctional diguanylate cyclase/phosphodiesterase [Simplicispira psychrophila]|uniref:bifunctional diguanylate cyclase/phosphodiesterase n=1 Tax=Simplicispira psychrophila TaxID=80882 RepID=UPI000689C38B|nr:EAL domain-containing protein [Simplicispira psychrophila]